MMDEFDLLEIADRNQWRGIKKKDVFQFLYKMFYVNLESGVTNFTVKIVNCSVTAQGTHHSNKPRPTVH